MRWGESCRIRHLLTRQYLTIVKGGEGVTISLKKCTKESEFDSAATFRLRPVIQGEDSIMYGSFARIYHPTTDTWLHAMKGTYVRKLFILVLVVSHLVKLKPTTEMWTFLSHNVGVAQV